MPSPQLLVLLSDVADERARQDRKWGGPIHDDGHYAREWLAFLSKPMAEALQASSAGDFIGYIGSMVKIAALAMAAAESAVRHIERSKVPEEAENAARGESR